MLFVSTVHTYHCQKFWGCRGRDHTMAYIAFLILLSFICTCIHVLNLGQKMISLRTKTLPPRISLFSIIRNYNDLFRVPHQALAKLSKTYGPIMSLKQGSMTIIVTSTPELAKEVLQTHDKILSGRPTPDAVRALDHYNASMIWLQPHSKWRVFRKICNSEMFSFQKVEARLALRQRKVQELLDYVQSCCDKGQAVDVGQVAFTTSLNLLSNTLFSIDLASYHSKQAYEFKELVWAASEQIGRPNSVDYYPILGVLDPQGIRRATKFNAERIIAVFEDIINQRLQFNQYMEGKDVIDAFLKFHKENGSEFSLHDIKHLLVDLFIAGAETTSSTIEWAITEALRNPKILSKAREELEQVIGIDKQILQESDISKLPYLNALVKETFRVHPAVPFLVHRAEDEVEIAGYSVPKDAEVLVNVWAIGRDPKIWSNPNDFVPERFLNEVQSIDGKGQDFELLPFGSGRRICPGMPLSYRMLHLVLGSLLHSFNWRLEDGVKAEDLNMEERFRFTVQKSISLQAIPIKT